jgi:hypothetical protein
MHSPDPMTMGPGTHLIRRESISQAFSLNFVKAAFYGVRQKSFKDHSFE